MGQFNERTEGTYRRQRLYTQKMWPSNVGENPADVMRCHLKVPNITEGRHTSSVLTLHTRRALLRTYQPPSVRRFPPWLARVADLGASWTLFSAGYVVMLENVLLWREVFCRSDSRSSVCSSMWWTSIWRTTIRVSTAWWSIVWQLGVWRSPM